MTTQQQQQILVTMADKSKKYKYNTRNCKVQGACIQLCATFGCTKVANIICAQAIVLKSVCSKIIPMCTKSCQRKKSKALYFYCASARKT